MFKNITYELSSARQLVNDASMIFTFLRGLGTQYILFTISIIANLNHLSFEDIIANLKSHDVICAFYQNQNVLNLVIVVENTKKGTETHSQHGNIHHLNKQ